VTACIGSTNEESTKSPGFGRFLKVLKPAQLAKWTEDELDAARQQYESGGVAVDSDVQPPLPFLWTRLVSA
jgi:hypothetical protein